jgi:hypothetical protein
MAVLVTASLLVVAAVSATVGGVDGGQPASSPSPGSVSCTLGSVTDRSATLSSACMTCHDGSKAVDARTGHRYDIDYRSAFDQSLRPNPQQFDPRIVLSNGKVTCLSCHDPTSKLDFHLAGPLDGPVARRMCVACHPHE